MNRGRPGLHRESIKILNTFGINRESTGRTGNDRRGIRKNRDGTGNNPFRPRQCSGNAPVVAGGAQVEPR
ncbi:hypothetical protein DPMN_149844 [Dreissena polymorpha]|uniref:Uncharacterized protein n=1 Tax=Dreissena polymorpha TaxID=45954 RepID=A0A9D4FE98_DREPO|nr:hypothetical protein DPMN_149844 [Dreissena polymorpha]